MDLLDDESELIPEELDMELLKDLEQQSADHIRKLRTHERLDIRIRIVVQPGNSSDRSGLRIQGFTDDISQGGCRAVLPVPIHVGDVFRINFDKQHLDLPLIFARCLRCRLLREDAFEIGFKFFTQVTLSSSQKQERADDLLG